MVLILYCLHFPRATTHTYFTYLFTPVANREVTGKWRQYKIKTIKPIKTRRWSTIRRAPLSIRCTIRVRKAPNIVSTSFVKLVVHIVRSIDKQHTSVI